jgi:hypothetical protein
MLGNEEKDLESIESSWTYFLGTEDGKRVDYFNLLEILLFKRLVFFYCLYFLNI